MRLVARARIYRNLHKVKLTSYIKSTVLSYDNLMNERDRILTLNNSWENRTSRPQILILRIYSCVYIYTAYRINRIQSHTYFLHRKECSRGQTIGSIITNYNKYKSNFLNVRLSNTLLLTQGWRRYLYCLIHNRKWIKRMTNYIW